MQNYQLTILINNTVEEKARTSLLDSLNKDLGSNVKQDAWGVRSLSYKINHQDKAFYAHFNFEADPSTIPAIDRKLKLNEDIIRYLLIKADSKKAELAKPEDKKPAKKTEKTEESVSEETKSEKEASTEETETSEEK